MTDRPILFSGPMVRALLAGRKTQTRRVLKPQPGELDRPFTMEDGSWHVTASDGSHKSPLSVRFTAGDRLWVREAWRAQEYFDDRSPTQIGAEFTAEHGTPWCPTFYEADRRCDGSSIEMWQQSPPGRLRAGMHMPRWAARLTLTVTEVRVQRLQGIGEADAVSEGCFKGKASGRVFDNETAMRLGGDQWANARDWYADLWDSLNASRGFGWDANPWVVAVTFTVAQRNIDEAAR